MHIFICRVYHQSNFSTDELVCCWNRSQFVFTIDVTLHSQEILLVGWLCAIEYPQDSRNCWNLRHWLGVPRLKIEYIILLSEKSMLIVSKFRPPEWKKTQWKSKWIDNNWIAPFFFLWIFAFSVSSKWDHNRRF